MRSSRAGRAPGRRRAKRAVHGRRMGPGAPGRRAPPICNRPRPVFEPSRRCRPLPERSSSRTCTSSARHPAAARRRSGRLVAAHPGARLVFLGDLFDLPASTPAPPAPRGRRRRARRPPGRPRRARPPPRHRGRALAARRQPRRRGRRPPASPSTSWPRSAPRRGAAARVRTSPWFFREGGLHLEHGHFYDPDNAPAHPLVNGAPSLGVHFVEEFIAPAGAHHYLQVNDAHAARALPAPRSPGTARARPTSSTATSTPPSARCCKSGPFYRAAARDPPPAAPSRSAFAGELGVAPRARRGPARRTAPRPPWRASPAPSRGSTSTGSSPRWPSPAASARRPRRAPGGRRRRGGARRAR